MTWGEGEEEWREPAPHAARGGAHLEVLDDARDDLVLDARVLALRVLADRHNVHVRVLGREALDALARAHVGKEVQRLAERQVQRPVSLADGRRKGALQADLVADDRVKRCEQGQGEQPLGK